MWINDVDCYDSRPTIITLQYILQLFLDFPEKFRKFPEQFRAFFFSRKLTTLVVSHDLQYWEAILLSYILYNYTLC